MPVDKRDQSANNQRLGEGEDGKSKRGSERVRYLQRGSDIIREGQSGSENPIQELTNCLWLSDFKTEPGLATVSICDVIQAINLHYS
jgi:hypothetical protein